MQLDYIPLLMFALLMVSLALGIPISFSLLAVALIFGTALWGTGGVSLIISATWGTMNNFTLIAIPLFIFMALILQKAKVVEDLYDAFYKWSGPLRGGLAVATVLVGAMLGAISGVVAAGVIGLGLIGLPQMLKYGYDRKVSLGSVMAGGTLGQLIPPSTNMVVYGAVTGVSIGGLFAGGITCGLLLTFIYAAYILIRSYINKDYCPALPPNERASAREKLIALKNVFLPAGLIILVLGSVLTGMSTPTEAAAFGAGGAMLFVILNKRFSKALLCEASLETLEITSMVCWIVVGASAFGAIFSGIGGNSLISSIASSLPGGAWAVFSVAVLFIFILGMFLEPAAMIMLAAPIVSPLIAQAGFDSLWWGLVFMMLLQVAYLSPPFGFTLFYMKGAASDDVSIEEIYIAALPFMALQGLGLFLIIVFPDIALWLPQLLIK
ncbi:MAG: TRAP transporter large permease subunit [Tannerellaceae bacterium]